MSDLVADAGEALCQTLDVWRVFVRKSPCQKSHSAPSQMIIFGTRAIKRLQYQKLAALPRYSFGPGFRVLAERLFVRNVAM